MDLSKYSANMQNDTLITVYNRHMCEEVQV